MEITKKMSVLFVLILCFALVGCSSGGDNKAAKEVPQEAQQAVTSANGTFNLTVDEFINRYPEVTRTLEAKFSLVTVMDDDSDKTKEVYIYVIKPKERVEGFEVSDTNMFICTDKTTRQIVDIMFTSNIISVTDSYSYVDVSYPHLVYRAATILGCSLDFSAFESKYELSDSRSGPVYRKEENFSCATLSADTEKSILFKPL